MSMKGRVEGADFRCLCVFLTRAFRLLARVPASRVEVKEFRNDD